jgi:CRISPR type III-B/RAMP module-associated protein Cmr3
MTLALLIEPLDLLFCRDGRPIVAGEGAAAGSALPSPQVMAGAIRSALLRQRGHLPGDGTRPQQAHLDAVIQVRIRGPLLADMDSKTPYIPMPADVVGEKPKHGHVGGPRDRLRPTSGIPGWQAPGDAPHALAMWPTPERSVTTQPQPERHRAGEKAAQSGYLTWAGFSAWAAGQIPSQAQTVTSSHLWTTETRTQVGLKPDQATAEDGVLFTTRYLRLCQGIGFYVEVEGADDLPAVPFSLLLGGDRRQVRATRIAPVTWPSGGTVAMALTPTLLPKDRCPESWQPHCRGLLIPGADPISGWDMAANHGQGAPRPTRWAIRAGAVWCLDDQSPVSSAIGDETASGFGWIATGRAPR